MKSDEETIEDFFALQRRMVLAFDDDPYDPAWERIHDKVADWHQSECGCTVCGCWIHQATCEHVIANYLRILEEEGLDI